MKGPPIRSGVQSNSRIVKLGRETYVCVLYSDDKVNLSKVIYLVRKPFDWISMIRYRSIGHNSTKSVLASFDKINLNFRVDSVKEYKF